MLVHDIDVTEIAFDPAAGRYDGHVAFHFSDAGPAESGTTHFRCRAELSGDAAPSEIRAALVDHAQRQLGWMPEIRTGAVALRYADGVA